MGDSNHKAIKTFPKVITIDCLMKGYSFNLTNLLPMTDLDKLDVFEWMNDNCDYLMTSTVNDSVKMKLKWVDELVKDEFNNDWDQFKQYLTDYEFYE